MRIAIVEDNPNIRKTLKSHLKKMPFKVELIFEAESVTEAVKGFKANKIDLAILDVEIKEGLIFEALNQLEKINFEVLFLSAHGGYAIDAFRYNALSFILKPIECSALEKQLFSFLEKKKSTTNINELADQLDSLRQMFTKKTVEKIALPSLDGINFHRFNEISWIKADANYCHFYLKNGSKIVVSKPLKEFVELLENQGFFRVHKSYIVNLEYIKQYIKGEGGSIILEDGNEVPVSRRKKESLLTALLQK